MKKKILKKKSLITFLLLLFLTSTNAVFGDEIAPKSGPTENLSKRKSGFHLALGIGVAVKNNLRRDDTYKHHHGDVLFSPIPLLQFGWGPISFGGQGLKADLYGTREWGIYTNIDRVRERYHGTGMEDRRDSWFWGLGGRYKKFSAHFAKDIQGRSGGKKFNINYSELYMIRKTFFTRSAVGLECYDAHYADYYYGVKATEVTSTRSEYHPGRYCVPTASFAPIYKLDENVSFISALSVKGVSKEVRHSPTTKGGNIEAGLVLGSLWQF